MEETVWGILGLVLMGQAMLSKSLIQFSVDGWGCVPSLLFGLRPNYDRGNGSTPPKGLRHTLLYSVPLTPQQVIVDPCLPQRLLYTQRQVWISLLWIYCSFLLAPGIHKVLSLPSKSLLPHSCGSSVIKTIPKKKKCKKAKWLSEEALQIAEKRREAKGKGEQERYTHLNAEFQRIARRDKKAFLSEQCKEVEKNEGMEKTKNFFKKLGI